MHIRAFPVSLAASVIALVVFPVLLLAAQPAPDASLQVEGAVAEYTVAPGDTIVHHMVVSLGPGAKEAMDIQVEARGLGQGPDGSVLPLLPEEDSSPYSARDFVKKIDSTAFRLAPGGSKEVNATVVVPASVDTNRYADLYIHALPITTQNLDIILAAHVPVLLRLKETPIVETASISNLDIAPIVSGRPIIVSSSAKNTGNFHFKTQTTISLFDGAGRPLATTNVPFAGSSIVPTFARKSTAAFGFLNRIEGLPVGNYIAQSVVTLPDGKVLDTKRVTFRLSVPYLPFPDIDPADLVVVNYNDEVPFPIDARQKADLELSFTGLGKVTGTVVLGRFRAEPPGAIAFAAKSADGGTGKDGLKFVGIGVQGFSDGVGHLSLYYHDNEIVKYSPASFFLGLRSADIWERVGGFAALPGAQVVKGDVNVATFNLNPVIGLGGDAAINRQVQSGLPTETIVLIATGAGGAAIGGMLLMQIVGGRRRSDGQPDPEPRPRPRRDYDEDTQ
jgi:hypothetical protein